MEALKENIPEMPKPPSEIWSEMRLWQMQPPKRHFWETFWTIPPIPQLLLHPEFNPERVSAGQPHLPRPMAISPIAAVGGFPLGVAFVLGVRALHRKPSRPKWKQRSDAA